MHICVISPDYPTSKTIDFVFVDQLCRALAAKGEQVTVIAPQTLTKCIVRHVPVAKKRTVVPYSSGGSLIVLRPKYLSVGTVGGILQKMTKDGYKTAVARAFKSMNKKPDVMYGHFWQSVKAAYPIAKTYGIPLFASSGEERVFQERIAYSDADIEEIGTYIKGSIHVSTSNRDQCLETGFKIADKSVVIPNSIDSNTFYPRDKRISREKLGVKDTDFLVAFVGQWNDRKGTTRLNVALKQINDPNIKAFFLGKGPEIPDYQGIVHKGTVVHDFLPEYLSAADVFVLPTQNEGCCNAIIEAMACGLPIISSNLPFNWDVLDASNSIMIDPDDIEQIKNAIIKLKDDVELRVDLSSGALRKASSLTLDHRAEKIVSFIKSKLA